MYLVGTYLLTYYKVKNAEIMVSIQEQQLGMACKNRKSSKSNPLAGTKGSGGGSSAI